MKTILTIFLSICILLIGSNLLQAGVGIGITVNGQASGASVAQGDSIMWIITGLTPGATVNNQLWIDADSNGVINPATDLLFVSFSETDGVTGGDSGPSDLDGVANGTINTILSGISFPVGHYIFKTSIGTDSASATFNITSMTSVTYTISGRVRKSGIGVENIVMDAETFTGGKIEFFGLTDASGNYTINTNVAYGTVVRLRIPTDNFNGSISGYLSSPLEDTLNMVGNVIGAYFDLINGKIITGYVRDTLGNPISNISVEAYPPNGGNNFNGSTDGTGKYIIAVPNGIYIVQFGMLDQIAENYVLTFYNQKYVNQLSDTIFVTSQTDTVKNINAVLRKGGVITGTVLNAGPNGWNIVAFPYNVAGNPLFGKGFNNSGTYNFMVLPGTYSIQFNKNGSFTQLYYNQSGVPPGTAVTVTAIGDTVRNIDADFNGTIIGVARVNPAAPKMFSLSQNFPNPFNPSTVINYQLPKAGYVTLKVYNVLGKEVATLVSGELSAGSYISKWDASQFASGIYFYKLQTGSFMETKKLILMK